MKKLKEWRKLKHQEVSCAPGRRKVFIRVWQQMNGWENQLGMFQASAFVPVGGRRVDGKKRPPVEEQYRNNTGPIEQQ